MQQKLKSSLQGGGESSSRLLYNFRQEKSGGHCLCLDTTALGVNIPQSEPPQELKGVVVAQPKFTRIPKTSALLEAGVPTEAIPTYCCLADYSNNKTGLCWPKMETLAQTLNRSVRTVQRHLHLLHEVGLIEFVERRRHKGRFSSYLYRVLHMVATTGHGQPVKRRRSNSIRTKPVPTPPKSPKKDVKEGYWWWFGEEAPPEKREECQRKQAVQQEEDTKQRRAKYDWFFK